MHRGVKAIAIVALVAGAVIATGVVTGALVPGVAIQDRGDWGTVSEESITVKSTIAVDDPYPSRVTTLVSGLEYNLWLNDNHVATGTVAESEIPADDSTVQVSSTFRRNQIPDWWVSHIRNGEETQVDVTGSGQFRIGPASREITTTRTTTFDTQLVESVQKSLASAEGAYSGPSGTQRIIIEDTSARWGAVNAQRTELIIRLTVTNDMDGPFVVSGWSGKVRMNEVLMAQWDEEGQQIRRGETKDIEITTTIKSQKIDDWMASHVSQGEHTDVVATLRPVVEKRGREVTSDDPMVMCYGTFETQLFVDDQTRSVQSEGCNRNDLSVEGESSGGGSSEDSKKARDGSSPDAAIDANPSTGEAPLTVEFDASGSSDPDGDIQRFRWQIEGGTPGGTGETITREFQTAGEYRVRLVVIDSDGRRDRTTTTVVVERR